MNSREREVSKIYHSSWILSILDFVTDAKKLNYGTTKVWKRVWILGARSGNEWRNGIFLSEIGSGFEEPGGTPLPRIPRSTPPGGGGGVGCKINRHYKLKQIFRFRVSIYCQHLWVFLSERIPKELAKSIFIAFSVFLNYFQKPQTLQLLWTATSIETSYSSYNRRFKQMMGFRIYVLFGNVMIYIYVSHQERIKG